MTTKKKSHEETWTPDDVIVMHNRMDGEKEARKVLAHAAPDMALALLDQGLKVAGGWHTHACLISLLSVCPPSCQRARAALIKAEVPLP